MTETLSLMGNGFINALYPVNILAMIAGVIALVYCAFTLSGSLLEVWL